MNAPAGMLVEGAGKPTLAAGLAAWRAANTLEPACSIILFGVGLDTLQRIERGEVEPEPELAERIGRVIFHTAQGVPHAPEAEGRRGNGSDPGPRPCGGRFAHASPGLGSPPSRVVLEPGLEPCECAPPPALEISAMLAKRPSTGSGQAGGEWTVILKEPGLLREIPIAHARALVAALAPLIAVHDDPELFER